MRIEVFLWTITAAGIQIRATRRTKASAVYSAKCLHRKRQQNLFAQDASDGQLGAREERSPRVRFVEFDLFVFIKPQLVALAEEQVKGLRDIIASRIQTPRAHQLHCRGQGSRNSNFSTCSFGRGGPMQHSDLPDVVWRKIDAARLERPLKRDFLVGQILQIYKILVHD